MRIMRLRRKIDGLLSEGRGMQLIWLAAILVASFFVFWGISEFIFKDGVFKWQDIVALYLDPGVFAGAGRHDFFRLFITIFGAFFFAAMLISVVSNIFENVSESYKKGETRYHFNDHVLILGANHMLIGMLAKLKNDSTFKGKPIVVMTTQPVEPLRDEIEAYFGSSKEDRAFLKRITFYYDARDKRKNLEEADAEKASHIFVIGEDGEDNHDAVSLKCTETLKDICKESKKVVSCCTVLDSQTTMGVYHYTKSSDNEVNSNFHVDLVNANEYEAEQVLTTDTYPCIDRHLNQDGVEEPGIFPDTEQSVHFVIFGLTQMGRAFATTAANLMHYPNFKNGLHRSKITFIGEDIIKPMNDFQSRYNNLFKLSHWTYRKFNDGAEKIQVHKPDDDYDDFLDIEWEFVDSHLSSPRVLDLLKEWGNDSSQVLNIAVCYGASSENTTIALNLPKEIYKKGTIPIFIHIKDYNDVVEKAKSTDQFGALFPFGAASSRKSDPLFLNRAKMGKRVNYIYNKKGYHKDKNGETIYYSSPEEAWYSYSCPEWSKLSSIYSGITSHSKARSFPSCLTHSLSDKEILLLGELEHRRWTMAELLLGYSAPTKEEKQRLISLRDSNPLAFKEEREKHKKNYHHYDMIPFDDLREGDKTKDYVIVNNIPYILNPSPKPGEPDLSEPPQPTSTK